MKHLVQNIILILLAAMLVLGILWAQGKSRDQLCTRVDVVIVNVDSTTFVTPQGVKEELKAEDQMEWVRRMNGIRERAEETVIRELIDQ